MSSPAPRRGLGGGILAPVGLVVVLAIASIVSMGSQQLAPLPRGLAHGGGAPCPACPEVTPCPQGGRGLQESSVRASNGSFADAPYAEGKATKEGMIVFHMILLFDDALTYRGFCAMESAIRTTLAGGKRTPELWLWVRHERLYAHLRGEIARTLGEEVAARVVMQKVSFKRLFDGLPFDIFYNGAALDAGVAPDEEVYGNWAIISVSDAMRLAILYKHGGFYMDADVIVRQDLSGLQQGFTMEIPGRFNQSSNHLLYFHKTRHPFVRDLMHQFIIGYRGNFYGQQGPKLVTRVWEWGWARRCEREGCDFEAWPAWKTSAVWWSRCSKLVERLGFDRGFQERVEESMIIHAQNRVCGEDQAALLAGCVRNYTDPNPCYNATLIGRERLQYCPRSVQHEYANAKAGAKQEHHKPGQQKVVFLPAELASQERPAAFGKSRWLFKKW